MDRAAVDTAHNGVGDAIRQGRRFDREILGRAVEAWGVGRGVLRQGDEGPCARRRTCGRQTSTIAWQADTVRAAQQSRHAFQCFGLRQPRCVPAAIEQPPARHGRNRRGQNRLAPGDGVGADFGNLATARLARRQGGDVAGAIMAAAGIDGIGARLNPPAADVGIERLRTHT